VVDGGSGSETSGGGSSAAGTDMGLCIPVHDTKRLATSKQPVRDGTKRWVTLFMEFLLYLLVVVVQDALTSSYIAAFRLNLCANSLLSGGMMELYVFTSAWMKVFHAFTGFLSCKRAVEYTRED
jgi:hypothetical protein